MVHEIVLLTNIRITHRLLAGNNKTRVPAPPKKSSEQKLYLGKGPKNCYQAPSFHTLEARPAKPCHSPSCPECWEACASGFQNKSSTGAYLWDQTKGCWWELGSLTLWSPNSWRQAQQAKALLDSGFHWGGGGDGMLLTMTRCWSAKQQAYIIQYHTEHKSILNMFLCKGSHLS